MKILTLIKALCGRLKRLPKDRLEDMLAFVSYKGNMDKLPYTIPIYQGDIYSYQIEVDSYRDEHFIISMTHTGQEIFKELLDQPILMDLTEVYRQIYRDKCIEEPKRDIGRVYVFPTYALH